MKTETIYTVCRVMQDWGIDTWAYPTPQAAQRKMYELLGEEVGAILEEDDEELKTKLLSHLSVETDDTTNCINYIQVTETDYITVEETTYFRED